MFQGLAERSSASQKYVEINISEHWHAGANQDKASLPDIFFDTDDDTDDEDVFTFNWS